MNLRQQLVKSFESTEPTVVVNEEVTVEDVIPSDEITMEEIEASVTALENEEVVLDRVVEDMDTVSDIMEHMETTSDNPTRTLSQESAMFANIALTNIMNRYGIKHSNLSSESYNMSPFARVEVTTTSLEGVGEGLVKMLKFLSSILMKVLGRVKDFFTSISRARKSLIKRIEALDKVKSWKSEGSVKTTRFTNVFVGDNGEVLTSADDIERTIKFSFANLKAMHGWGSATNELVRAANAAVPFVDFINNRFKGFVGEYFSEPLSDKTFTKNENVDKDLAGESKKLLGGVSFYVANIMGEGDKTAVLSYGKIRPEIKGEHEEHEFEFVKDPQSLLKEIKALAENTLTFEIDMDFYAKNMRNVKNNVDTLTQIYKAGKDSVLPKEYQEWVTVNFPDSENRLSHMQDYKRFIMWIKELGLHPWLDIAHHEVIMLNKVVDYLALHEDKAATIEA